MTWFLKSVHLENPWVLLFVPMVVYFFYKACQRQQSLPTSVWAFLCPSIREIKKAHSQPLFQKWRFALLCGGLVPALAILLNPTWPAPLWVLCMQGRSLENLNETETELWLQRLSEISGQEVVEMQVVTERQEVRQNSKPSSPIQREIVYVHPLGSCFKELSTLKTQLTSDDYSIAERPQRFINYAGPKIIASPWQLESWGPHAILPYRSKGSQQRHITVSALPSEALLLVGIGPVSGISTIQCGDWHEALTPAQSLGQEALKLAWTFSKLEFCDAQGHVLETLDLPEAPAQKIKTISEFKLASELEAALGKFKLSQSQTLSLVSAANVSRVVTGSAAWVFWNNDDNSATLEVPSGLPLLLQTTSLCPRPILHAGFDWPVEVLPRRAFIESQRMLVGSQGFSLVRWLDAKQKQMDWRLPPTFHIDEHFWRLMLETTFPSKTLIWSKAPTIPEAMVLPNERQGWSPEVKLFWALLLTILWTWGYNTKLS